jgi:hypothetical protein
MSTITVEGSIQVRDSNDNIHTIPGDDFDLDHVSTDHQRQQGPELIYEATYETDDIEITLSVAEYPEGTYNSHDLTVGKGSLVADQLSISIKSE